MRWREGGENVVDAAAARRQKKKPILPLPVAGRRTREPLGGIHDRDRGVDGGPVLSDAVGEGRDGACACSFRPWVKICVNHLADHRMESGDD